MCLQIQLLTRLTVLLDTLHRHKRTHGNLTPAHIVADSNTAPALFSLLDMSCSRSTKGALGLRRVATPTRGQHHLWFMHMSRVHWMLIRAEEGFLQWGTFDVRFAAPETVLAALTQTAVPWNAAADFWSLGTVLFEVATGRPYWAGFSNQEIVQALLAHGPLPHEGESAALEECPQVCCSPASSCAP